MSTGGGISPFDPVSLDAQTPVGLYQSLETWNLVGGREKAVLRVCVGVRKGDIIIEA